MSRDSWIWAWIVCATIPAAHALESGVKTEWKPPLTLDPRRDSEEHRKWLTETLASSNEPTSGTDFRNCTRSHHPQADLPCRHVEGLRL
jgi:hypothetical protein